MIDINDCHQFNMSPIPEQVKALRMTILQQLRIEEHTLRDQFAMAALTAILHRNHDTFTEIKNVAKHAYGVADAMLEARKAR